MGDVLDAVHLTTAVFGRLNLGAPWRLRVPERAYLSFYVLARGSAWLEAGSPEASSNFMATSIEPRLSPIASRALTQRFIRI